MNNKIIHILITIISISIVCVFTMNKNRMVELVGYSENWDITLTIENKQSTLKIYPKNSILKSEEDIYYSYNLYKGKNIISAVRFDFFNYKNPSIEKRVSFREVYKNELYGIEIECNDIREVIILNKTV
ncbi:hypothetical protein [Clostridium sp. CCUG 7971]|uniref:hypothetical protein n=1 Tax=Clostridium sp. CCUG 7971 TaxID=2811414 RepID=UPI001ABA1506|nr:hypothetical protein [Clostridium sp. CCUG 7971]MBO3445139.1 hypothetical protein [Clostridium sp. CCUG 7971]